MKPICTIFLASCLLLGGGCVTRNPMNAYEYCREQAWGGMPTYSDGWNKTDGVFAWLRQPKLINGDWDSQYAVYDRCLNQMGLRAGREAE